MHSPPQTPEMAAMNRASLRRAAVRVLPRLLLLCLCLLLLAGCSGFSPWGGYRQGF